jgi:ABC-type molybdate transport system substrate-binding protein
MKNALDDVDAAFTNKTGIKVVTSYDASSGLMKQIGGGAPADAFVSADLKWMDYGVEKRVINESTRINLLRRRTWRPAIRQPRNRSLPRRSWPSLDVELPGAVAG